MNEREFVDALKIPPGWRPTSVRLDGTAWYNPKKRLMVIVSASKELDGKQWVHASISHSTRLPSYEELKYLKRHFIGADRKAIQVFPSDSEHVNIHPKCLHLFCCLDDDPLPDFTHGLGCI